MKRLSLITTLLLVFGVTLAMNSLAAERGGHPGGAPRGGAPHPGGAGPGHSPTPQKGGGMGGGISPNAASKEKGPGGANKERGPGGGQGSTSPFGAGGTSRGPGGANAAEKGRPGAPGTGAGNTASGAGTRPGAAAAAATRPGGAENGANVRPGAATGAPGANAANTNSGVRPGTAAAVANNRNPANTANAANAAEARPGNAAAYAAGYGRGTTNEAANAARYGTYYRSEAMLADQTMAVRAATVNHATYDAAMYSRYATAWAPANLTNSSLYSHPGYGALSTGLKFGATQPMPYDYGANVVMQNDAVYVNGSPAGTPQEYAAQATQLATTGRDAQPAETSKWLPLGVFALVEGDATNSNDVFQLAVNPQGVIRGNYHNLANDQVENVVGSVDKETQRVAWTIGSDESPVYEAGVANLTKDATPVLIHVGDGQTRQLTFIRLEEPASK